MKEVRETKLVEQTTVKYIAKDGREFKDENECMTYERRLDHKGCERDFDKLYPVRIQVPFLDWFSEENEVVFVDVNNDCDFNTIADYYASISDWMDVGGIISRKPEKYPASLVLVRGGDWVDIATSETKESFKKKLEEILEKL